MKTMISIRLFSKYVYFIQNKTKYCGINDIVLKKIIAK